MDKTLESSAFALVPITVVIARYPFLTFSAAVFLINLAACAWVLRRESPSQRWPKLRRATQQIASMATIYVPLVAVSLITKALGPVPYPMLQSLQEAAADSVLFLAVPILTFCFWARWRSPVRPTKQDESGAFLAASDEQ